MTLSARTICWSASAALSLTGLALATYLSVVHLSGADLACGASGGCGAVTTSEYSRFLGIPVAMLGVAGYAALLLGNLAALGVAQPTVALRWGVAGIACVGFAFSAYLTVTQAFLIGSYCIYCLTSASLMTALTVLTLTAALREDSVSLGDESGSNLSPS